MAHLEKEPCATTKLLWGHLPQVDENNAHAFYTPSACSLNIEKHTNSTTV